MPMKVDDKTASRIRERYASGKLLMREIAAEFGISPPYVQAIISGRLKNGRKWGYRKDYESRPHEILGPTVRRCSRCREPKVIDDFYPSPKATGGHGYLCKPCSTITGRLAKYRKQAEADPDGFALKIADGERRLEEMRTILAEARLREDP